MSGLVKRLEKVERELAPMGVEMLRINIVEYFVDPNGERHEKLVDTLEVNLKNCPRSYWPESNSNRGAA